MSFLLLLVITSVLYAGTSYRLDENTDIQHILPHLRSGDTLLLPPGIYSGNIAIGPNITLMGEDPYTTIIDGDGRGNTVTMRTGSSIIGCTVRNGTIGIKTQGRGITIKESIVTENRQSGLLSVGTLPTVKNSLFAHNRGAAIQATAITETSKNALSNLTFFRNGSAISYEGSTTIFIENSAFVHNGINPFIGNRSHLQSDNNLIFPSIRDFDAVTPSSNPSFISRSRRSPDYRLAPPYSHIGINFTPTAL